MSIFDNLDKMFKHIGYIKDTNKKLFLVDMINPEDTTQQTCRIIYYDSFVKIPALFTELEKFVFSDISQNQNVINLSEVLSTHTFAIDPSVTMIDYLKVRNYIVAVPIKDVIMIYNEAHNVSAPLSDAIADVTKFKAEQELKKTKEEKEKLLKDMDLYDTINDLKQRVEILEQKLND